MGFPYSSGDVLTAADMNAIGSWSNFTPSFLNFSASVNMAKYAQVNELVFINMNLNITSTVGATMFIDDMPVDGISGQPNNLYAVARDVSVNDAFQSYQIQFSGSTAIRFWGSVGGTGTNQWSVSYPFTWVSGDRLWVRGFYTAA